MRRVTPLFGDVVQPGLPPFSVISSADDGVHTVCAAGELDLATAPELRAALEAAADSDASLIRLDLREVSFIDSTGVAVLVEYAARLSTNSGRLRISTGAAVDHVLAISGTRDRLPLID